MDFHISISVDLSGLKAIEKRLETLDAVIRKAATDVYSHARNAIISGPKTGLLYHRGSSERDEKGRFLKKGKTRQIVHQASAEGEAPANDTGILAGSLATRKAGDGLWEITAGTDYAETLETRRKRPFLLPALMAVKDGFLAAVAAIFRVENKPHG